MKHLSGDVRVRSLDVAAVPEAAWPALLRLLDDGERGRAAQFHHEADRRAYVAAHALQRHLLSESAGGRPEDWQFVLDANGKPELATSEPALNLRFNLSHTRGMVVACAAHGASVGVDVEDVSRHLAHLKIADRFFAPEEAASLRACVEGPEMWERFTSIWTLKEAFLKAAGTGLAASLDGFVFTSIDPVHLKIIDPVWGDPGAWRFWTAAHGRYRMALALTATEEPVDVRHVTTGVSDRGDFVDLADATFQMKQSPRR